MINRRRALLIPLLIALLVAVYGAGYTAHYYLPAWATVQLDRGLGLPVMAPPGLRSTDLSPYWEVWQLLERDFYGESPDLTHRTYASIRGLVESYQDAYTYFVEPAPHELDQDRLQGEYGGIGAWLERDREGILLRPIDGQPAALAGVQDGDRLEAVDGRPMGPELSVEEVTALIRGPVGSRVCLALRRPAAEGQSVQPLSICIVRAEIQIPSMEWRLLDQAPETATIGYIRHDSFSERSPQEMEEAVADLAAAGATGYILDLRDNPGGLLQAAVDIADLWLDGGLILIEEQADGDSREFMARTGQVTASAPLVIIVNGGSASASEIVAGALQDNGRAVLIGERTFGKGSVQLIHELADQSSLHVTYAHWYTPRRRAISGAGLLPDIVTEPGGDPLPQAIRLVQELSVAAQRLPGK